MDHRVTYNVFKRLTHEGPKVGRKKKAFDEERRMKAVRLRNARFSWDQIAKHCGYYDGSAAYKAVAVYWNRRNKEPLDHAVMMELDLLDDMARGVITRATSGDVRAIAAMLKIVDMRAKLTGMYPKQETSSPEDQIRIVIDPRMITSHAATKIDHEEVVLEQAGEERPL